LRPQKLDQREAVIARTSSPNTDLTRWADLQDQEEGRTVPRRS